MNESNIGNAFKDKFETFSEVPEPQVWNSIKHSLPQKKFKPLKYTLITTCVVLIAGIGFFALQNTNKQATTSNVPVKPITTPVEKKSYSPITFFLEKEVNEFSIFTSPPKVTSDSSISKSTEQPQNTLSATVGNTVEPTPVHIEKQNQNNNFPTITPEPQTPVIQRQPETAVAPAIESPKQTVPQTTAPKSTGTTIKEPVTPVNENTIPVLKNNPVEEPTKSFQVWVPKAFTPNQEPNNIFSPKAENVASFEMVIYNKGGQVIFKSKDINTGWDGRLKNGSSAPQDAYIYIIKCVNTEGIISEKKGAVTLLR